MKVLVTGGTGFIGQALVRTRLSKGDEVTCLSRNPLKVKRAFGDSVRAVSSLDQLNGFEFGAVINLAGEPIADGRWSDQRKKRIRQSRVEFTEELVRWIAAQPAKPSVLVSGSAIGYYGSHRGDVELSEQGHVISGFTHSLCADWEARAARAEMLGVRVCQIRTGVVMGHGGGALKKMLPPFRLGLGGPVGHGQQWMSWVHLADEVRAIEFLLEHDTLQGAFNLTAPHAVRNREFSRELARVLKRPAVLPLPGWVVGLMLGEGAELLLEGQRVYPHRLLEAGFQFVYPELPAALEEIVGR